MITVSENIDLKEMTTFGLPARCGMFIEYSDAKVDLPELDRRGHLSDCFILGGGSNLLFISDRPDLTVIHPTDNAVTTSVNADGSVSIQASPAVILDDLCRMTAAEGWWGIENLSDIPGQLGGAAVQNVGAYGTELCDVVTSLLCYSLKSHEFITQSVDKCNYGYRDSIFKHLDKDDRQIVCQVNLKLQTTPTPNLGYKGLYTALCSRYGLSSSLPADENIPAMLALGLTPAMIRDEVIRLRDSKLPSPKVIGSAGSFFKNPVVSSQKLAELTERWETLRPTRDATPLPYHRLPDGNAKLSAAWLIDRSGCKPLTAGGAALWQSQPLVIVNSSGNATGEDVLNLEQQIIGRVERCFGITLSPEVIHIQ